MMVFYEKMAKTKINAFVLIYKEKSRHSQGTCSINYAPFVSHISGWEMQYDDRLG